MLCHVSGTMLMYTSWGSGSYAPGHELKAMAAKHIFASKRPWGLCWVLWKCTTANFLTKYTAKWGVDFGQAKKKHMQGLWESGMSEYPEKRYTSLEKWPAIALPEQMNSEPNFSWPPESTSLIDFMVLIPLTPGPNLVQCFTISKGSP